MTDFAAYVFFVNRPDLLQRAVDAFPQLQDDLTIIDNSPEYIRDMPFGVSAYRPPVPFSYTQSMNFMLKDAIRARQGLHHPLPL